MLIQRIIGGSLLAAACVVGALGVWSSAAIVAAAGVLELVYSGGVVTVDGDDLVLASVRGTDRVGIAGIASVDANFTGYLMRAPHLTMHWGESVPLTPFRCSTLLRTRSRAAEQLGEHLGVPVSEAGPPAFRVSWFGLAAVISVGFLFGLPLLAGGIAELVDGGILSGTVLVLIGGGLCAVAVRALQAQRARNASRSAPTVR